jgi:hypothetical protein
MTYDQWKTMSPDDERAMYAPHYDEDARPEECDHSECSYDPRTGREICYACGLTFYTSEEMRKLEAKAARKARRARLRERWLGWWDKWWRPRNRRRIVIRDNDDKCPF